VPYRVAWQLVSQGNQGISLVPHAEVPLFIRFMTLVPSLLILERQTDVFKVDGGEAN
jgi:hypothetical protein